jgi:hypothetical protein
VENLVENNIPQAQDTATDIAVEAPASSGLDKLRAQLAAAEEVARNAEKVHRLAAKETERLRQKIAIEEAVQAALVKERQKQAQVLARALERQKQKYIKQIERMELALEKERAKQEKPKPAPVAAFGTEHGQFPLPEAAAILMKEMVGQRKDGAIPDDEDRVKAFLSLLDNAHGEKEGTPRGVGDSFAVQIGKSLWTFTVGNGLEFKWKRAK